MWLDQRKQKSANDPFNNKHALPAAAEMCYASNHLDAKTTTQRGRSIDRLALIHVPLPEAHVSSLPRSHRMASSPYSRQEAGMRKLRPLPA